PRCGFIFFANPGVGAACVLRNAAGHVLLVKRAPGQFGAGRWCFPCGFVEWGEDVRAAAAREAREEAGMEVVIGEPVQVTSNFHEPEKPTVGIWFAARRRPRRARSSTGWCRSTCPSPCGPRS